MPRGVPKNGKRRPRGWQKMPGFTMPSLAESKIVSVVDTNETDDEILARLNDRFSVMTDMALATAIGQNRAMIVSGPAGLGKSHGIGMVLEELGDNVKATIIKGFVRSTGLYKTLFDHREPGSVVIFDDADSIFFDDVSLNILKTACDTTSVRRLSWLAETRMEDEEGERLPRHFVFEGSIIFITNYDFDQMITNGHRLAPHFEAMISRSHYLDLSIKSRRDYLIRIKQVVEQGMLRDQGFTAPQEQVLLSYITKNADILRELSLRMVVKLANLMKIAPASWEKVARATCHRNTR